MLGEFYSSHGLDSRDVSRHFYVTTLECWLIYNDDDIYYSMLDHFEQIEYYPACDGINKAIKFIERTVTKRFEEASIISEDDESTTYDFNEYKAVSSKIFYDVLLEIYEEQIRSIEENS